MNIGGTFTLAGFSFVIALAASMFHIGEQKE
jgi:hypothetical protein